MLDTVESQMGIDGGRVEIVWFRRKATTSATTVSLGRRIP